MAQITGRVYITVNGNRLASKPGATLQFAGVEREMVEGDSGPLGWSEKTKAPGMECTIAHSATTSLAQIRSITAGSGSFDTDTGKSFVLTGIVTLNALELSGGEVKVTFGALDCKEV